MEHYYLVYVPGGGNSPHTGFGQSSSVFGTTLTLDLVWTGNAGTLFNLVSSSESAPGLKIVLSRGEAGLRRGDGGLQPHSVLHRAPV